MDHLTGLTICLVGQSNSGKGTVATLIGSRYNIGAESLSDELRLVAASQGLQSPLRDQLQLFANELRRTYGNDILARLRLEKMQLTRDYVVEGIRHLDELACVRSRRGPNLLVCGLYADLETRFERAKIRGRASDQLDWVTFVANDQREWGEEGGISSQNTRLLMNEADVFINNNGTEAELEVTVIEMVDSFLRRTGREIEGIPIREDQIRLGGPRKEMK